MAIFSKKTWKDMIAQFPNRRKIINTSTGEESQVEVFLDLGKITETGAKWSASEMNDLETRINTGFNNVEKTVSPYATRAESAATAAETSKNSAATSEFNASKSAQDAATSKSNAESSALTASNSVTQASTYASSAKTSETNAQTHASTASSKASAASTSATNAKTSETKANSSALDAEAYALGTRNGEAVGSSDPAYHNNSKYWSDYARTGVTFDGDYNSLINKPEIITTEATTTEKGLMSANDKIEVDKISDISIDVQTLKSKTANDITLKDYATSTSSVIASGISVQEAISRLEHMNSVVSLTAQDANTQIPKINSWLNYSARNNGVLSDALLVDITNKDGDWNKPRVVDKSSTASMPEDCAWGVRTVEWFAQNAVFVKITGVKTDGKSTGIWVNGYWNNVRDGFATWIGWTKLLNVVSFDVSTGTLYTE